MLHHFHQSLQIQDDEQDMFASSDEEMPPPPSRVGTELPERLKIFWRLKSNCTNWCFVCRLWRQRTRLHLDHMASAQGDCHRILFDNADIAHSIQCFISKFKIQVHLCLLTMFFKISSIGRLTCYEKETSNKDTYFRPSSPLLPEDGGELTVLIW